MQKLKFEYYCLYINLNFPFRHQYLSELLGRTRQSDPVPPAQYVYMLLLSVYRPFGLLTLFRLGGGGGLQVFPCCAETACSMLMKISDFQYNYIGHHFK